MTFFLVRRSTHRLSSSTWLILVLSSSRLWAAELYEDGRWQARLDTTIRYSVGFRVNHADQAQTADPNSDDADRNFKPGLISNRIDLLSQFDVSSGPFGFDASAAAWFDSVYFGGDSNNSPQTFNPASVPNTRFPDATRNLDGRRIDLLNAFIHGTVDIDGKALSFRLGRHALLWGESLYFAGNGIAAGQAPIDAIKAASAPLAQARELYLPVNQASVSFQPADGMAIDAYYQFEWRPTRLPGVGSYFSTVDFLDAGGERLILAPGDYLGRTADRKPPANGQFGVALHFSGTVDFGLYALRFNAKDPELFIAPAQGSYWLIYPKGIETYGVSFSGYLGDDNVAGELSARRYMPLVSQALVDAPGFTGGNYTIYSLALPGEATSAPLYPPYPGAATPYASGNTLHEQFSWLSSHGASPLWDAVDLSAEVAANQLLAISEGASGFDHTRTHFAAAFRAVIAPRYFQVLPGLDFSVPLGLSYDPIGRSSVDSTETARTGSVTFGIDAVFRQVWEANLSYTKFLGPPGRQPFTDRSFAVVSVQRSF